MSNTLNIGSKISSLRKTKDRSQSQLAKNIEVSREIAGRYKRNDAVPSIDVAKRIADALDVSLDYPVGNAEQKIYKITLGRIQEINKLKDTDKNLVYAFPDAFITKSKLQNVL
ncbi:MAG: helix-turn-helix domain-containing protein [Flavobacteriaceae bacterium]|jgi:ribosome-binding protein aMBF1 (putative translation factor)|nr:helix-turn-helix domain-containing protein [Flavobacteriaceae bacterium]